MKIGLQDEDGTLHEFPIPNIEDITVGQWMRAIALPDLPEIPTLNEAYERKYELVSLFVGIPIDLCRRIPLLTISKVEEVIYEIAERARHEREETRTIPATVDFRGVTYTVPHDLGQQLTVGQYVDLCSQLEGLEREEDGIAVVLAVMLNEGGVYQSSKTAAKVELFKEFPFHLGVRLSAFFFVGNEQVSQAWDQFMSRMLRSRLQVTEGVIRHLQIVGGGTSPSPDGHE